MKFRLIPALLLVMLWSGLTACPAGAFPFSSSSLVESDVKYQAVRFDDFSDEPFIRGLGWDLYIDLDEFPLITAELVRDEAWLKLVKFERDTSTILPVLSAQLFLTYRDISIKQVQRIREAVYQKMSRISPHKLPDPGIPVLLRLMFPGQAKGDVIGLLEKEARRRGINRNQYGNLLSWLFEEEGLFSGNEWDWENFLPRLLSVVALVVAGLFLIEFLRFLANLGMRAVGNMDKRKR
ncbi:MAG: hypothetical protein KQH53_17005 [Desulfarculaceae bacterium]|nr:hypothetical protein [Desulfarculaceae bacterium]